MKRVNWRLVFGIAVSAVSLYLILSQKNVSLPDLLAELAKANYLWLIPAALVQILAMWLRGIRWRELLNDRLPLLRAFHIANVGNFLNNVLPLRLGELGRAYLASRNSTVTPMQALSTVLIERLLDVLSVFLFLIVVLPLVPGESIFRDAGRITAVIAVIAVVGLFVAAAFREAAVALARRLLAWLPASLRDGLLAWGDDFLQGVSSAGGRRLVAAILWSVVIWIGWSASAYFVLLAFIPDASWHAGVFVNCALALGLSIPSAPSGAGLYELAAVQALAAYGVSDNLALAYAITSHVFGFVVNAIFGTAGLDREGESFGHIATAAQNLMASVRNK